jgi:endonuclease/exonuclease/phosphatase family metal-dependent hydrolase
MLRVLTYNVKFGGAGGRWPSIMDVIRSAEPDVVALQELSDFDRSTLERAATEIGMRAFLARSWFGQPVGVLSKRDYPVRETAAIRFPFHHAAAVVSLTTGIGPLTVVSTHLCPYSGQRRRWEALRLRRQARNDPVLIMGDLNTLEPGVDHTDRLAALPESFRRRHIRRGGSVDTRAVEILLDAGFVDVARALGRVGHTAPTGHGGGEEFHDMRLDYVLASAPLAERATDLTVLRGGAVEHASDHYPVLVTFAG